MIVDRQKIGFLQVLDGGGDGFIPWMQDCYNASDKTSIYEACILPLVPMVLWIGLHHLALFLQLKGIAKQYTSCMNHNCLGDGGCVSNPVIIVL